MTDYAKGRAGKGRCVMAKHKKPKPIYEDLPLCDCGAMHSAGSIDDWGCAACGDKPQDQDEEYDDE